MIFLAGTEITWLTSVDARSASSEKSSEGIFTARIPFPSETLLHLKRV